jgi:hypothetical protein
MSGFWGEADLACRLANVAFDLSPTSAPGGEIQKRNSRDEAVSLFHGINVPFARNALGRSAATISEP